MFDDDELNSQLITAAGKGDLKALSQALCEGANAKAKGSYALQQAAQQGHADCVKRLIPVSDALADESLALRWAAGKGHLECVRLLIEVSDPKAEGSRALRWAALRGHAECVKLLIPASDHWAVHSLALIWAAQEGHAGCVALLLPLSDLLAVNEEGLDAAGLARKNGHMDVAGMIEAFIERQALSSGLVESRASFWAKKLL